MGFPKVKGGMSSQGTQRTPAIKNRAKFVKKLPAKTVAQLSSSKKGM